MTSCPTCGHRYRSDVAGDHFVYLVVVLRLPTSSAIDNCTRCGAQGQLESWLDEAITIIADPACSYDERLRFIWALNDPSAEAEPGDEQTDSGASSSSAPPPMDKSYRIAVASFRIAVASLLVSVASLANDLYGRTTSDPARPRDWVSPDCSTQQGILGPQIVRSVSITKTIDELGTKVAENESDFWNVVDGNELTSWRTTDYARNLNRHSEWYEIGVQFASPVRLQEISIASPSRGVKGNLIVTRDELRVAHPEDAQYLENFTLEQAITAVPLPRAVITSHVSVMLHSLSLTGTGRYAVEVNELAFVQEP